MCGVVSDVVHEDQGCAVPGRKMVDNLILLRDMIGDCMSRKQKCMLLSVDFEKAFRRVSHEYMFGVLERMGFPKKLMECVKSLYSGVTSEVLVRVFLTEKN